MPDISPNCQVCGANPGEPCGKGGLHLAARCPINISALDGMEDDRNEISIGELGNMMRRSKDSFENAWGIVKIDDSDCQDVMDLMDSHGLSLMEAVRAFSRITGMNRRESRDLYRACMEYRDSGVHESANLAERMRDD